MRNDAVNGDASRDLLEDAELFTVDLSFSCTVSPMPKAVCNTDSSFYHRFIG